MELPPTIALFPTCEKDIPVNFRGTLEYQGNPGSEWARFFSDKASKAT